MHPLRQGAIVWAQISDPHGNRKARPLVIITESEEILPNQPLAGVAISTTFPEPPGTPFVELPWHPKGHPVTGLRKRSAAAWKWVVSLTQEEIIGIHGYLPHPKLVEILSRIKQQN